MTDVDLDQLREALDDFAQPAKVVSHSAKAERIIAGFEEIERFVEVHGRIPQHGDEREIFERLYAVRLDRIRESAECREVLKDLDPRGLLGNEADLTSREPTDEELLSSFGTLEENLTNLVHVRSREEIRAAEEIARRDKCEDFELFRPIFEAVRSDLESGKRLSVRYEGESDIEKGDVFIIGGQTAVVASAGEEFISEYDRPDRRLRVIYDNGTETDLLLRSLQRALHRDKASRRIVEPRLEPLFSGLEEEGDIASGYIYVLRSKSDDPFIWKHRDVIHKIGVTEQDVKSRLGSAKHAPTYLLSEVELVATFKLANINAKRLEALIHKFFSGARLDLRLKDRFGVDVESREWFLVPLPAIEEAVEKIMDGSIGNFRYDPESARLLQV